MAHSMAWRLMWWPKTHVPIHVHRCRSLADDFGVGRRRDVTGLDAVEVHGDKLDAVGVMAGEVGADEDVGDIRCDVVGRARQPQIGCG